MITRELEVTLNQAVREAEKRRHDLVCLEHILLAMLQDRRASAILRACGVNFKELGDQLRTHLGKLDGVPSGQKIEMEQTAAVTRVMRRAAIHVQSAGKKEIDAGDVMAAMLREQESHAVYLLHRQGVSRLDVLDYISHGIAKNSAGEEDGETRGGDEFDGATAERGARAHREALANYTVALNDKARAGKIDPLIGRAEELKRTIHVLCRRRKNNPILVGEAGVGKTAIAEGLALAVVQGRVPKVLADAEIFSLDMGSLIAGTKFRGEFEQRLKAVVAAVGERPHGVLFIDEIHTIVGAGAVSGGTLDASNILKPMLAAGEVRCLGATTYSEFRSHFAGDRALARRFQKIDVPEPSVPETVQILRGLKGPYEDHHHVTYVGRALQVAAELAAKHLTDRFLPDKAIDVMDEAGAAARLLPATDRRRTIGVREMEAVVARAAKVPTRTVAADDKKRLGGLEGELKLTIYGQDEAVAAVVSAIKVSRAGLGSDTRPVGSFLFAGPTGVGKTELARQLAKALGIELLRFDMSEYSEKHTISRLIGAPPGYVGFDQGGLLTDAVVKTPHAVVLLDEIEKAHPDIYNILLQVMDYATLTDSNGRKADFRQVIVIMTTNAGAREMSGQGIGFGSAGQQAGSGDAAGAHLPARVPRPPRRAGDVRPARLRRHRPPGRQGGGPLGGAPREAARPAGDDPRGTSLAGRARQQQGARCPADGAFGTDAPDAQAARRDLVRPPAGGRHGAGRRRRGRRAGPAHSSQGGARRAGRGRVLEHGRAERPPRRRALGSAGRRAPPLAGAQGSWALGQRRARGQAAQRGRRASQIWRPCSMSCRDRRVQRRRGTRAIRSCSILTGSS